MRRIRVGSGHIEWVVHSTAAKCNVRLAYIIAKSTENNGKESRRKNANKNTQISVPAECIIHIQLCPCVSSGVICKVSVAD